jgi:hypothetical protein
MPKISRIEEALKQLTTVLEQRRINDQERTHHEDRDFHIDYIEKPIFTDPGYIEHTGVILSIFGLFDDTLLCCSYM